MNLSALAIPLRNLQNYPGFLLPEDDNDEPGAYFSKIDRLISFSRGMISELERKLPGDDENQENLFEALKNGVETIDYCAKVEKNLNKLEQHVDKIDEDTKHEDAPKAKSEINNARQNLELTARGCGVNVVNRYNELNSALRPSAPLKQITEKGEPPEERERRPPRSPKKHRPPKKSRRPKKSRPPNEPIPPMEPRPSNVPIPQMEPRSSISTDQMDSTRHETKSLFGLVTFYVLALIYYFQGKISKFINQYV